MAKDIIDIDLVEVLVFVATFFVTFRLIKHFGKSTGGKRRPNDPPCIPSLPLIGSLPFFPKTDRLYHYFMEKANELGDVFTFYAARRLMLVLNGHRTFHDALVNHAEDFADRCPLWTEENILNKQLRGITFKHYDETFKHSRKLCQSALREVTLGRNATSEARIMSGIHIALNEIQQKDGIALDPKDLLTEYSGMVLLGILFGERFVSQSCSSRAQEIIKSSIEYIESIDPVLDIIPSLRFLPKFRKKIETMKDSKRILLKCLEEELEISIADDANVESFVRIFADQMEANGSEMDKQELIHILRDLVFGGIIPVSTTLMWALVLLANNPQIQNRIRQEVDSVVPIERFPSLADKDRLPFAEASVLEVMRKKGVAPFASTHATLKDTEVNGYFVPAGCMVLVNQYSAHMNSKDWKDPDEFKPERFLDENQKITRKDHIIPFGIGLRSCVGEILAHQAIFLLLCALVQQFHIQSPDGSESISEEEVYAIVLAPKPFNIHLIPRHR